VHGNAGDDFFETRNFLTDQLFGDGWQ
jgi:hypothetical protein